MYCVNLICHNRRIDFPEGMKHNRTILSFALKIPKGTCQLPVPGAAHTEFQTGRNIESENREGNKQNRRLLCSMMEM